ncbi:hypothetical protein L0F63_002996 [Massospora cicadina]|nr:hypothetical protein L0F63_002996 [Massospora cicadina]
MAMTQQLQGYDGGASEPIAIVKMVLAVISMILNLLLMNASSKLYKVNLSHKLIMTVSFVDFACSVFSFAMCILRVVVGEVIFRGPEWYCNLFGFTSIIFTCTSALLIGILGIERYLRVCCDRGVPKKLTACVTASLGICLLITGLGTSATSGYMEDPTLVYCLPYGNRWSISLFTVSKVIIGLSLPILVACYLKVFLFCRRHERIFPAHTRSPRTLIFIVTYCICFFPATVFILCESILGIDACPRFILILVPVGLSAVPVTNPFLVLALNHQMRSNLPNLFKPVDVVRIPDIKLQPSNYLAD